MTATDRLATTGSSDSTGLIVHEWIESAGGSERVVDSFSQIYPDADIFCLWNDAPGRFAQGRVRESYLARTPLRSRKALSLPVMPDVWRRLEDREYAWVLSSSHAFSHQVSAGSTIGEERHFSYVHTPARYLWTPELDGRGSSAIERFLAAPLRRIDKARAEKHQNVAANSAYIRDRIKHAWGIDAIVIHPPVEVASLQAVPDWSLELSDAEREILDRLPEHFVLGASRFIPYKRLDLVISAGEEAGIPVVIAGSGVGKADLLEQARRASVPVTVVDAPSNRLLRALMARAAVYVFPPVEDFGIMPVEAMALGTPVVVNPVGGAIESIVDGVTGTVAASTSPRDLATGIERSLSMHADDCRARARAFSAESFSDRVREWMGHA